MSHKTGARPGRERDLACCVCRPSSLMLTPVSFSPNCGGLESSMRVAVVPRSVEQLLVLFLF
jgi:hypothetical protein